MRRPSPRKAYLRVEGEPGELAQVDWGSFGHLCVGTNGAQRAPSAFVMVLSWSRARCVDFALDQRMETFLAMHRRALESFGGVPKRILYDNLKSVVVHHVGATAQFNPRSLDFAGHYLFEPVAAPARYPEAKGTVESMGRYLRPSFFCGRVFTSLHDVREQAARWLTTVANERVYGTTRERPSGRLLVERPGPHALPERAYDADVVLSVVVDKEARGRFDTNSYSVPAELVGKPVLLRADEHSVRVVHEGAKVARHPRSFERRAHVEDPAHGAALLQRRRCALGPRRKDKIAALSDGCRMYLQEIAHRRIDLENELRRLLRVQLLYDDDDLRAGMEHALAARTLGARFARGLAEPPEPIVTGNAKADAIEISPHDLESYDALFTTAQRPSQAERRQGAVADDAAAARHDRVDEPDR